MSESFDQVKRLLGDLSEDELRKLSELVKGRLGLGNLLTEKTTKKVYHRKAVNFYEAVFSGVNSVTAVNLPLYSDLSVKEKSKVTECKNAVDEFLKKASTTIKITEEDYKNGYIMYGKLTARFLLGFKDPLPLLVNIIFNQSRHYPALLNQNYPECFASPHILFNFILKNN